MKRKKKQPVTKAELLVVIDCRCMKCGGPARIFPPSEGEPRGVCVCAKCSPFWLGAFEEWKLKQHTIESSEVKP